MADTTPTDPVPDAGTSDPVPEASTSETVPPARKPLSKQFNYQRLELPTPEQMQQQDGMNNCVVRALMAGAGGLVLGAGFGIVMGAMDPAAMDSPNLLRKPKTTMQVLKESAVLAKNRSITYSKAFSSIGLLYSGIECLVESNRAKHDIYNSVYSGCFTGGLLARSTGPAGICFGCASFAAFSALMDRFMGIA